PPPGELPAGAARKQTPDESPQGRFVPSFSGGPRGLSPRHIERSLLVGSLLGPRRLPEQVTGSTVTLAGLRRHRLPPCPRAPRTAETAPSRGWRRGRLSFVQEGIDCR